MALLRPVSRPESQHPTRLCPCALRATLSFLFAMSAVTFPAAGLANSSGRTLEQASAYFSQTDMDLTIRKVAVLPVIDNLDGIYSRPIEGQLINLVKAYHQWDYVESEVVSSLDSVAELEENPDAVKRLGGGIDADAFLVARASKGPNGLTIKLNLFLKNDGKLFAREILKDHPRFDINNLKESVRSLFSRLTRKVPYDGLILSRQGNRVTVNLGKSDGIVKDQILTVVQIIKTTRHPKFNFLVSTEKEILGKVKVLKVDDTLSFGAVISELDKGVVSRFHKLSGLDQVTYPEPDDLNTSEADGNALLDRGDSQISFGRSPEEWLPARPPSFGAVGLRLGVGTYGTSLTLDTQTLEAKAAVYPSLKAFGELWLDPHWTVRVELEQGIISVKNPKSGSSPSELNQLLSHYSLLLGYNVLLQDDFFGPKLQLRTGVTSHQIFIDTTTPVSLTSTTYSGLLLGLHGTLPVTEKKDWYLGAGLNVALFPSLQEKPYRSGASSKNRMADFHFTIEKKLRENLRAVGALEFSLYSTSFSGTGSRPGESASTLSQQHKLFSGGIVYMY